MMKLAVSLSFAFFVFASLSFVSADHVGRDAALDSIKDSESAIAELSESGFSVDYFKSLLESQRKAFNRADLAESLRTGGNGSLSVVTVRALQALDYEKFSYDDVTPYNQEIRQRRDLAYEIYDSMRALEIRIGNYVQYSIDTSVAADGLSRARGLFASEDYDGAESAVDDANADLDERKAGLSNVKLLLNSGTNFFEANRYTILSVVVAVVVASFLARHYFGLRRKVETIRKLKLEEKAVERLMKDLQVRRFEKSSIPRSVYAIRMEKYRKRLNEIKRTIPLLESRK